MQTYFFTDCREYIFKKDWTVGFFIDIDRSIGRLAKLNMYVL